MGRAGLWLAAALALLTGAAAQAAPRNALDAYVARPDPAFRWSVHHSITGSGYRGAVLELTSQTWLDAARVDKPVWRHWLTVIVPEEVRHDKAFLYITGGKNSDPAPKDAVARFARLATDTHSVVAELDDVPSEPLRFAEQPDRPRTEDEIIAYQQRKFADAYPSGKADPETLVRFPMVKSGAAAMTAVQQYMAGLEGGRRRIDGFVVSGGSKRAWTSWLVAATDKRVVGVVPIVINVLSVDDTAKHHWGAMGYFSPALKDYVENGLIPDRIGSPGANAIQKLDDPLNYMDRPQMRMPKFVINAVGDEYFPPDNTRYGYHKVPEVKRLRMLPNSKHSTAGTDIMDSITAFYGAVLNKQPIPSYSWTVRRDGAIVVRTKDRPLAVKLWSGTSSKARDFRVDTLGPSAFTAVDLQPARDGSYVGGVDKPAAGYTAYFVELTYPSSGPYPFKFTTEVSVIPDVLPYAWKDARPILAPDGR